LPAVVTIHDAIPERFPELTLPSRRDRWAWRAKVQLALSQARLVLTVSEHAARDIARHLDVAPERLRVTLEGVADVYAPGATGEAVRAAAIRAAIPAGARWLMYVGGFGPHKHVDTIVRAHARVATGLDGPPLMLILAGAVEDGFHSHVSDVRRTVEACGTSALVRWPGYLPDEELRLLHTGALALVLISSAEGFGLPAVEAARCGTPVIATTESPLPDLLAGGGVFVAPGDETATARGIEMLVQDEALRQRMGARALARASGLSWPRAARVAIEALSIIEERSLLISKASLWIGTCIRRSTQK
jgi:alpha-1,3-rhamnosyl/mannosyltransferase